MDVIVDIDGVFDVSDHIMEVLEFHEHYRLEFLFVVTWDVFDKEVFVEERVLGMS